MVIAFVNKGAASTVEFSEYLKNMREKRGLTIRQLEAFSGVSNAYISQIESGERKTPSPKILKKLAKPLRVSIEELYSAAGYLGVAEDQADYTAATLKMLPVLGIIRAGSPLFADENIIGYEPANADDLKGGEYFYLRVTGDSMIGSRIQEGDLVLVRKQDDVNSGQIAVVMVNSDEATIKKVYKQDDQLLLQADNPKYPPMILKGDDVKIIGIVVKVEFKVGS